MATSLLRNLSTSVIGATFIAVGTITAPSHASTLSLDSTFGDDMAGMVVTVDFLGGGSQTAIWDITGVEAGAAIGTNWSLAQSGNTFFDPWTFSNSGSSIVSLVIEAIPGNTAFDTIYAIEEPPSTPGSALGQPFFVLSGQAPDSFTYSDEINISEGDLFGTLSLSFGSGFIGEMTYLAETDNGTPDDPLAVPESSSVLGSLAVGAFGVGWRLWRRKKQEA